MSAPCPLFGFRVMLGPRPDLVEPLTAFLEARGLIAEADERGLVVSSEAGQATEADREAVVEWTRAHSPSAIEVGPLGDLRDAD